jgi:hypothetical protein
VLEISAALTDAVILAHRLEAGETTNRADD